MKNEAQRKLLVFLIIIIILALFLGILYSNEAKKDLIIDEYITNEDTDAQTEKSIEAETEESAETGGKRVYISGAVNNPDVYRVPEDYRVIDVIENAAGGFSENADRENINLADFITDGQHIKVPEMTEEGGSASAASGESSKININTADVDELTKLSGIGASKAENIISYREANKFQNIEEIKNVKGIGDGIYENIKDNITVR